MKKVLAFFALISMSTMSLSATVKTVTIGTANHSVVILVILFTCLAFSIGSMILSNIYINRLKSTTLVVWSALSMIPLAAIMLNNDFTKIPFVLAVLFCILSLGGSYNTKTNKPQVIGSIGYYVFMALCIYFTFFAK